MRIAPNHSESFMEGLKEFNEFPMMIPTNSIMIFDQSKALALVCIYTEAGVAFVHGLYRSKNCSLKEFSSVLDFLEGFFLDLKKEVSLVLYTKLNALKRRLIKHNFKQERTTLFYI